MRNLLRRVHSKHILGEPLQNYGLLDAYEFFLGQLANSGIPQGNVYEFAAQAILRY